MLRYFWMAVFFVVLAGCGGNPGGGGGSEAGAGYEPKTPAPEQTTSPAVLAVGDPVEEADYTIRVLDVVETQDWTYKEAWANNPVDATSMSGKFVTVWYSLRNTGDYPLLLGQRTVLPADVRRVASH